MGIFSFLKKSVSDLFIASPTGSAQQLIWFYPDRSIPHGTTLTVRSDECALFFSQGVLRAILGAGTHPLQTSHLPFLGDLLVSPFSGDNHFVTELFFVRTAEHIHHSACELGGFNDVATRLYVSLHLTARLGVRVTDPARLVVAMGGQRATSGPQVDEYIDARIASLASSLIGRLATSEAIGQIVSNQYGEELGRAILDGARASFAGDGFELTRCLEIKVTLDAESAAQVREYSRRQAELGLQREGAEIGRDPGFTAYQVAQGQRAMLEGLGQGAANGRAVVPIGFGGMGGIAMPMVQSVTPLLPTGSRAAAHARETVAGGRWYLRTDVSVEGPYGSRQLVLRAIAAGMNGERAIVRPAAGGQWQCAQEVDELAGEFARRTSRGGVPDLAQENGASHAFERALAASATDNVLSIDELEILAALAIEAGLARDSNDARALTTERARALGCSVTPAIVALAEADLSRPAARTAPPPPTLMVYSYSNGMEQSDGLSVQAIAARVRALPDGTHIVWRPGMTSWRDARGVPEISVLVS